MNCNNKHCIWSMFDTCCHEDFDGHEKATPNQLDCPSALRSDFEEEFFNCYERVVTKIPSMNFKQLRKLEKVINGF